MPISGLENLVVWKFGFFPCTLQMQTHSLPIMTFFFLLAIFPGKKLKNITLLPLVAYKDRMF